MSDARLGVGEQVLLIDPKRRRYLVTRTAGAEFHTHAGYVHHDDLIGAPEGSLHRSTTGTNYLALRPTLSEHVLKMPRGAQVIYPKDLGAILMLADISAGMAVFESGVGSGALSSVLLRAGATVTGYELREDFANRARKNVADLCGQDALARYDVQLRDAYSGIEPASHGKQFDRAVLDLPEPWQVVPHLQDALRCGGVLVAYNPSVVQVQRLRRALDDGPWQLTETIEVLHRGWHIEGEAVRPDHRMVAHTGFLTYSRLVATNSQR